MCVCVCVFVANVGVAVSPWTAWVDRSPRIEDKVSFVCVGARYCSEGTVVQSTVFR